MTPSQKPPISKGSSACGMLAGHGPDFAVLIKDSYFAKQMQKNADCRVLQLIIVHDQNHIASQSMPMPSPGNIPLILNRV